MSNVAKLRPAPAPAELHHLAFAEAFANAHADDRRHWATRGRWMAWSAGEGWREATEPLHDMARAIDRIVPTDERAAWYRVNHLRDALTMAAESLSRHEWDQGDAVLGLPAGRVVELTTGEDRAQTPDDWITMATGCDLADEISIPWLDFVSEACGGDGEMASALQAAVGASAFGHNREHRVEVLCGDGGTGKSTFAETVAAALGGYAGVLPASVLNARNEQHPTGIAGLLGTRFATAPEVTGGTFRSETLKAISGGDAIPARFMRQDFFTFQPAATIWIPTNEPPAVRLVDHALRRRLRIWPFEARPADPDPPLPARLRSPDELRGVLRWIIEGANEYAAIGLHDCQGVRDSTATYFEATDSVGGWFEVRCEKSETSETAAAELYRDYCAWCEDEGMRKVSRTAWGTAVGRRATKRRASRGYVYAVALRV